MMTSRIAVFIVLLLLTGVSCRRATRIDELREWHETATELINDQANEQADSVFEQIDLNENLRIKYCYYEKQLIRKEYCNTTGAVLYRALYAADTNLKRIQEYTKGKRLVFDGIEYKNKPYGLAAWYYPLTGKLLLKGYRMGFYKAGRWEYYNRQGKLVRVNNYPISKKRRLPKLP